MEFLQSIDWMGLVKCFIVGGIICVIGQILIDKTKLTPARILVLYVTLGAVLGGLGIYKYLIDFAGAGATVPLTGFGANLAKGAIEEVKNIGLLGAFVGGVVLGFFPGQGAITMNVSGILGGLVNTRPGAYYLAYLVAVVAAFIITYAVGVKESALDAFRD